jgi:hypothetical protein
MGGVVAGEGGREDHVATSGVAIAGVEHDDVPWDCDVASSFDY